METTCLDLKLDVAQHETNLDESTSTWHQVRSLQMLSPFKIGLEDNKIY